MGFISEKGVFEFIQVSVCQAAQSLQMFLTPSLKPSVPGALFAYLLFWNSWKHLLASLPAHQCELSWKDGKIYEVSWATLSKQKQGKVLFAEPKGCAFCKEAEMDRGSLLKLYTQELGLWEHLTSVSLRWPLRVVRNKIPCKKTNHY